MHHDENDPRHTHNPDLRQRREHRPPYERERYFNDFKSRWGEPSPPLNLRPNEWEPRNIGRFEQQGQFHQHREEWLPERRGQQPSRHDHQHREPIWRQRDVHFDSSNQRTEDRWEQDDSIPHLDDRYRRRQGSRDSYRGERDRSRRQ